MPGIRERDQSDKIKNQGKRKGGKPVQQKARRVMTAKLKKELTQQKRGGSSATEQPYSDSTQTEAVNQVEQTARAAIQETGQQIKRGVSRAVTKAKKDRQQIKGRQEQPREQKRPVNAPAFKTKPADRIASSATPRTETPEASMPPSATKVRPVTIDPLSALPRAQTVPYTTCQPFGTENQGRDYSYQPNRAKDTVGQPF